MILIKPLSVNEAFRGRKFKTDKYHTFQKEMKKLLPDLEIPEPPFILKIQFGFSSKGSDLDNVLKQTIDCLSKKYGFNDNQIYRIEADKHIVKKGNEFINFKIEHHARE